MLLTPDSSKIARFDGLSLTSSAWIGLYFACSDALAWSLCASVEASIGISGFYLLLKVPSYHLD